MPTRSRGASGDPPDPPGRAARYRPKRAPVDAPACAARRAASGGVAGAAPTGHAPADPSRPARARLATRRARADRTISPGRRDGHRRAHAPRYPSSCSARGAASEDVPVVSPAFTPLTGLSPGARARRAAQPVYRPSDVARPRPRRRPPTDPRTDTHTTVHRAPRCVCRWHCRIAGIQLADRPLARYGCSLGR